jgi:tagatose-1,6-bisphosphate aldolase non-catalytic subunit AgaZ/GatZ
MNQNQLDTFVMMIQWFLWKANNDACLSSDESAVSACKTQGIPSFISGHASILHASYSTRTSTRAYEVLITNTKNQEPNLGGGQFSLSNPANLSK